MVVRYKTYLKSIFLGLALLAGVALVSCTDEIIVNSPSAYSDLELDESDIIDATLTMSINDFAVSTGSTRADEPTEVPSGDTEIMSDFEKTVDNIWVFQYDTSGNLLIQPRYYTATESENNGTWSVLLKPVASTIYVVTNVNVDTWASSATNFSTTAKLLASTLPEPYTIYDLSEDELEGHIPMKGCVDNVTPVSGGTAIVVPVEHMYAKVKVRVVIDNALKTYDPTISSVYAENCPWYCRIGTLYDGTTTNMDSEYGQTGDDWVTRTMMTSDGKGNNTNDPNNNGLTEGETYDYVIYIPENIQGEVTLAEGEDANAKADNLPSGHPTHIVVDIKYTTARGVDGEKTYTVYPGGNNYNNFNIRRNQVYRVTMVLGYPDTEHTPSANSIVGHPGHTISFEPYYRVETGGGYDISTYLDPTDESKTIKGMRILWQTENCIGDNSALDKVYIEVDEDDPVHSKVYVQVNAVGNAVVAAYADEDCEGDIIWSWHIWVTNEDPTNISNAVTYYTYDWDETGIYGNNNSAGRARVPGYGMMSCNLGALASVPASDELADKVETYGLEYQWGRKDPFPGLKNTALIEDLDACFRYDETSAEQLYDNSNEKITGMTDYAGSSGYESYLFHSITSAEIEANNYGIDYTIKHPTVFMCGTKEAGKRTISYVGASQNNSYNSFIGNYSFGGGWMKDQPDNLWGGEEVTSTTKSLVVATDSQTGDDVHLYDDYGTKSIFDPCPYGWRVSPPDQWLGFTSTGLNPTSWSQINTPASSGTESNCGMYLYVQDWKNGLTTWFPSQGFRAPDGSGCRARRCGNYHNATADSTYGRVNILHTHNSTSNFNIFEVVRFAYHVKATAGPVRCVRDTK